MSAIEFVDTLRRDGFSLTLLSGDRLEVRPASRLTPKIREELKQRKAEVLALLTQGPTSSTEPVTFWTDGRNIDPANPPAPYLNDRQELVIPFECAPKYRWWQNGQSIHQTLRELGASPDVLARYVDSTEILKVRQ